jgi:cephalosporin-C deacetylase-like acetyl esterase
MLLEGIIAELSDFRRALRGEDRAAFDSLMNKAREHASSCTVVPTLEPMDAVFLSILVEQEKEIISLRKLLSNNDDIILNIQ